MTGLHTRGVSAPRISETSDTFGRPLHDLRISVTDRCNFRCVYCMPKEIYGKGYQFLPKDQLLTFEELGRLVRIFASLGVRKIRLTGGEPLMRRDLEHLVADLSTIPDLDLTLTTNGSLLATQAAALKAAGLKRVTVSLDSLDDVVFKCMNDVDFPVARVLEGIAAAKAAGLEPIKVNMVVRRGLNEDSIVPMARYFREQGQILRFIEYMDVGHTNGLKLDDVVPAREIVLRIDAEPPLEPVYPLYLRDVASRSRYRHGSRSLCIPPSTTHPFCPDSTRTAPPPLCASCALARCQPVRPGRGHDRDRSRGLADQA